MLEKLLDNLRERYPNKLPNKEINSYQLGLLVGQNNIIEFIAEYIDKATANPITTTSNNIYKKRI